MASVQCYRTCQESCQQKSLHGSLGQQVPDMFKGHHNHHNAGTQSQTHCYGQSQMIPNSHSGHHNQYNAGTHTHTHTQCYGQNQMLPHSHAGHAAATKMTNSNTPKTTEGFATGIYCSSSSSRKCYGRSRREHKQGSMFQKSKDGLSGRSSDCSDSESDSDNENCHSAVNL